MKHSPQARQDAKEHSPVTLILTQACEKSILNHLTGKEKAPETE